ncbi:zinc finger protein ZPR1-like [Rhopilema esculentum]|uniref:zinc finger protein ZPR1-like n=1 Tax=Rhopilema esculentum TaxID=499914 RepID=UPI0031DB67BF
MALESTDEKSQNVPLFRNLTADDEDQEASVIQSMCTSCEREGTTRLLFTKIPFFKEIILISFECPHCGNKNNEIQSAGPIQDKGSRITTKITGLKDLNRQVVKQSSASFRIPELDLESEAFSQKGALTTVEGVLQNVIDGLEQQQKIRKVTDKETAAKIEAFIEKVKVYQRGEKEFTLIIEDISGNSYVENPHAPGNDPNTKTELFSRTTDQNEKLGFFETTPEDPEVEQESEPKPEESQPLDLKEEVLQFPCNCHNCNSPAVTNMKIVQIPHFKEVIIMATNCDKCGYRTNEVKSGGGVEPCGVKITLKMTDASDLNRDVLKSETCQVMIPELDFEVGSGSIGGRFTTVEGLLTSIKEQLETSCPFFTGDSAVSDSKQQMKEFVGKLDQIIQGENFVTIVLDDPVGNSYIQNVYAPDPDPEMTVEKYERTFQQNEEYGLNDMKV